MIKKLTEDIQKKSKELLDLYYDKDGLKKEEIDILAGNKNYLQSNLSLTHSNSNRTPDVWYNFYEKIKEAKIVNKNITNDMNENITADKIFDDILDDIMIKPLFSVEENKGRCFDLHEIFMIYMNLKKV
jgi:hypothetical protein